MWLERLGNVVRSVPLNGLPHDKKPRITDINQAFPLSFRGARYAARLGRGRHKGGARGSFGWSRIVWFGAAANAITARSSPNDARTAETTKTIHPARMSYVGTAKERLTKNVR